MARLRIGERQKFALQVWILDAPADYAEVYELPPFPARREGSVLVYADADKELVWRWLTAASNLADDYMSQAPDAESRAGFRTDAKALSDLGTRVLTR
jgi:hypothetical protein